MRLITKSSALMAAASLMAASCSESNQVEDPIAQQPIPINISMDVWQTRVSDAGYELNDRVGIYVVNNQSNSQPGNLIASGNHVDNMAFTKLADRWNPDQEIFWADKQTRADIYCYFPYSETIGSVTAHLFSVQSDQSSEAGYKASELLWGKASQVSPTAESIPLTTYHSLSNIIVYLQPGNGFTAESLEAASKQVRVCSVRNSATVNLSTGVVTPTGEAGHIVPKMEGNLYRALVVPQVVAAGSNLISVSVDGVDYTFAKGFEFRPNMQHSFTVTINKTSGGIDIGVGGWETDGNENGGDAE